MRRALLLGLTVACAAALIALLPAAAGRAASGAGGPVSCDDNATFCTEPAEPYNYEGNYIGHDEPALLFYSNTAGSGNSALYRMTLPTDPPTRPAQDGSGGTFNFQLHPAFWLGMAMCDDQAGPNPGATCTPDSDSNIFNNPDPTALDYMGLHPGTGFMEMQFYPPGWVGWPNNAGSCDPVKWCAALNIDSFDLSDLTGQNNNNDCLEKAGFEYVNFAFITRSGVAQAPADPLRQTLATFTPTPSKDLMMHSGDTLTVDLHDTAAGFQVVIHDLTTGQSGSMTASIANGFGHPKFDPNAATCTDIPYAFHPMYSTSSEATRVLDAAHTYNVAFSDEIGHFEYCNAVDGQGGSCTQDGVGDLDTALNNAEDDFFCFAPPFNAVLQAPVKIGGCTFSDGDFDGVPYQNTWPGTIANAAQDAAVHPSSVEFSSPLANGSQNYSRVAFEADLSRIEGATNPPCQRHVFNPADPNPGQGCVNPPVGDQFYPIYSTASVGGSCVWHLGGTHIPGTTNTFGGTSTAEYGPLLAVTYPAPGSVTIRDNDFRNILGSNPCPAG